MIYQHKSKYDEETDFFRVVANNGLKTREAQVQVHIRPLDRYLPLVVVNKIANRRLAGSRGSPASSTVYRGATVVIDERKINVTDEDTPSGE